MKAENEYPRRRKGAERPFRLLFTPRHRAEVLSQGIAAQIAAHVCALDSTEELWHPRPKGVITRTALLERGCYRGSLEVFKRKEPCHWDSDMARVCAVVQKPYACFSRAL